MVRKGPAPRRTDAEISAIRESRAASSKAKSEAAPDAALDAAGFCGLTYVFSRDVSIAVHEDWQACEGNDTIAGLQWAGGVLLARYFDDEAAFGAGFWERKSVLELGAGCGLTSCLLAALGASVVCTDAEVVHAHAAVAVNAQAMRSGAEAAGAAYVAPRVEAYTWGVDAAPAGAPFDVIVCGDCLYAEPHGAALVSALLACAGSETEVYVCGAVGAAAHEAFQKLVVDDFDVEALAFGDASRRGRRVKNWGSRQLLRLFRKAPDEECRRPPLRAVAPARKPGLSAEEAARQFGACFGTDEAAAVDATDPDLAGAIASELSVSAGDASLLRRRVAVVDGALTDAECDALVAALDSSAERSFWAAEDGSEARAFRDADTVEAALPGAAALLWRRTQNALFPGGSGDVEHVADDDIDGGAWRAAGYNDDFLFATYPAEGSFAPHSDGATHLHFNRRSHFSVIIYLNEPAGGGGTAFYEAAAVRALVEDDQGRWTAPAAMRLGTVLSRKGRLLVFDQRLVHEGVPPENSRKHIIRSDIMFDRCEPRFDNPVDRAAYAEYHAAVDLAGEGRHDEARAAFERCRRAAPDLAAVFGL
ncbi:putative methyltransferase-domain-containing protein [Pelagophyceae sp. CCMP2097]|nr:putative methyltransferase-domain-containing protein [Pelagophyceae sp. CCMP2097]